MAKEKRMAACYEITQAMRVGEREIVFGVNESDPNELTYMVGYFEFNGLYGHYYDLVGSNDFIEIAELYGQRIAEQADKVRQAFVKPKLQGIDLTLLTEADCTAIDNGEDLRNKVIVLKPDVLRPEYRKSICQLYLCTGGFGAALNSRGSAVFCTELYSGNKARFERHEVMGVLEPEQMPKWAKYYLEDVRQAQEKERKRSSGKEER